VGGARPEGAETTATDPAHIRRSSVGGGPGGPPGPVTPRSVYLGEGRPARADALPVAGSPRHAPQTDLQPEIVRCGGAVLRVGPPPGVGAHVTVATGPPADKGRDHDVQLTFPCFQSEGGLGHHEGADRAAADPKPPLVRGAGATRCPVWTAEGPRRQHLATPIQTRRRPGEATNRHETWTWEPPTTVGRPGIQPDSYQGLRHPRRNRFPTKATRSCSRRCRRNGERADGRELGVRSGGPQAARKRRNPTPILTLTFGAIASGSRAVGRRSDHGRERQPGRQHPSKQRQRTTARPTTAKTIGIIAIIFSVLRADRPLASGFRDAPGTFRGASRFALMRPTERFFRRGAPAHQSDPFAQLTPRSRVTVLRAVDDRVADQPQPADQLPARIHIKTRIRRPHQDSKFTL